MFSATVGVENLFFPPHVIGPSGLFGFLGFFLMQPKLQKENLTQTGRKQMQQDQVESSVKYFCCCCCG